MFKANFSLERLAWVPQRPAFSLCLCSLRYPVAVYLQLSSVEAPHPCRRSHGTEAKQQHTKTLSLIDFIWSIGNTICSGNPGNEVTSPYLSPLRCRFLKGDPVSSPVPLNHRKHTISSVDGSQSPVLRLELSSTYPSSSYSFTHSEKGETLHTQSFSPKNLFKNLPLCPQCG